MTMQDEIVQVQTKLLNELLNDDVDGRAESIAGIIKLYELNSYTADQLKAIHRILCLLLDVANLVPMFLTNTVTAVAGTAQTLLNFKEEVNSL